MPSLFTAQSPPLPWPWPSAEVCSAFESREHLWQLLRASCHMPLVGGVLPYGVRGSLYFDGLFWSQTLAFVQWRGFLDGDEVVKVSPLSLLGCEIKPRRLLIPPWWGVLPPPKPVLDGMMAQGYADAEEFFASYNSSLPPVMDTMANTTMDTAAAKANNTMDNNSMANTTMDNTTMDTAAAKAKSGRHCETNDATRAASAAETAALIARFNRSVQRAWIGASVLALAAAVALALVACRLMAWAEEAPAARDP